MYAHRCGGPFSSRPLSPRPCKAAAPKDPAFCFLNYLRLAPGHRCCRTCNSPTHYWDFSSNRRELALGADGGCLVPSWNHSKSTSCLLTCHKYRNTNHHAAASRPFKFVPAPLGVAHDTNATRLTARTTAPPCPSHTRRMHGTGRADAYEASFVSRVVVVASSSVRPVGVSSGGEF